MIVHSFDPVLIDLGLFQIRWYSIAYILGIIIGWYYAIKIIKLTNKFSACCNRSWKVCVVSRMYQSL